MVSASIRISCICSIRKFTGCFLVCSGRWQSSEKLPSLASGTDFTVGVITWTWHKLQFCWSDLCIICWRHCFSVPSFLWLHYLLEPNVPKSSLMYVLLNVYQDAFLMLRGYLNLKKNYLMTSGHLSIRASISRWFLPLVCVVIAFGWH